MQVINENHCEQDLIIAYIDGELESATQVAFTAHLEECAACRADLREQQRLICELDAAFNDQADVVVPRNFSRVVAARAESDMSGVRSAAEHRKALAFCLLLGLTGFALLGATAREMTIMIVRQAGGKLMALGEFACQAVYDSIASVAVISRVISRKFLGETINFVFVLGLLALAVFLLSRLISSYHRTGTTD